MWRCGQKKFVFYIFYDKRYLHTIFWIGNQKQNLTLNLKRKSILNITDIKMRRLKNHGNLTLRVNKDVFSF